MFDGVVDGTVSRAARTQEPAADSRQAAVCTSGQRIVASARRCVSVSVETVTSSPDLENA